MTAGRPAKFNDIDELEKLIESYFEIKQPLLIGEDKTGKPIYNLNPPTLTGLALHLGFESRQSIYDYEKRNDGFSYTIKKARLRCENYVEDALLSGTIHPAGAIFVLKNYGWKDTLSVDADIKSTGHKKAIELLDDESVERIAGE